MPFDEPYTHRPRALKKPYTIDGVKVPSVTTVLDAMIHKAGLVHWAWRLGREGKDYIAVRNDAADAGTLCHEMVTAHLEGRDPVIGDLPKRVRDDAEVAYAAYFKWAANKNVEPLANEIRMTSKVNSFGGTCDLVARIDGRIEVIDFKTGAHYDQHMIQLAAYAVLVSENKPDWLPAACRAVYLPRTGAEPFDKVLQPWLPTFKVFERLLDAYRIIEAM